MRIDSIELSFAARRERAKAIAAFLATSFAWLLNHAAAQPKPEPKRHAARPHFAR